MKFTIIPQQGKSNSQYEPTNSYQTLSPLASKMRQWCPLSAKAVVPSITKFQKSLKSVVADTFYVSSKKQITEYQKDL